MEDQDLLPIAVVDDDYENIIFPSMSKYENNTSQAFEEMDASYERAMREVSAMHCPAPPPVIAEMRASETDAQSDESCDDGCLCDHCNDPFEFVNWMHDHPELQVEQVSLETPNRFAVLEDQDPDEREDDWDETSEDILSRIFDAWIAHKSGDKKKRKKKKTIPQEEKPSAVIQECTEKDLKYIQNYHMRTYGGGYYGGPRLPFNPHPECWRKMTKRIGERYVSQVFHVPLGDYLDDEWVIDWESYPAFVQHSAKRHLRRVQRRREREIRDNSFLTEMSEAALWNEGLRLCRALDRVREKKTQEEQLRGWEEDQATRVETVPTKNRFHSRRSFGPHFRRMLRESKKQREMQKALKALLKTWSEAKDQATGPAHFMTFPENIKVEHTFPFLEQLMKALEAKNPRVQWTTVLRRLGFMIATIATAQGKPSVVMVAVTQFITELALDADVITWLLKKTAVWFGKTSETSGEAHAVGAEGLFVPLLTLVGVVLSVLGVSKLPDDKSVTSFIMRLSKIGACIKSVETLKEYILPAAETVVDYVRVNVFGYSKMQLDAWKSYEDYCDEIQKLNNSGFEARLKTEGDLVVKIDELMMRGDNLMKVLDSLKIPPAQRSRFNTAYAWLARMRTEAAHCPAGKHIPRVPPIIVHLVGTTGVGKSEATHMLNARLLASLGYKDPADMYTMTYFRDAVQERFDGYNTNIVGVVIDDFGSRKDTEARPSNEPFEAIRMQNSAIWQLPMASLSEKGSTFFRAKYLIWTSNQTSFDFKSITNPEAVMRRVTLKFVQKPRREFSRVVRIGQTDVLTLDQTLIDAAAEQNPDVYSDVWTFDQIDPMTDPTPNDVTSTGNAYSIIREGLSFEEMSQICVETLHHAQKIGKKKLSHTERYFEQCVEREGAAHGNPGYSTLYDDTWYDDFKAKIHAWWNPPPTSPPPPCPEPSTSFDVKNSYHLSVGALLRTRALFDKVDIRYTGPLSDETCDELAKYRGVECICVKNANRKVAIQVATGLIYAYEKTEAARLDQGVTDLELDRLFARCLHTVGVRPGLIQICDTHKRDFWGPFHDFCANLKEKTWRQWEKVPESWRVNIDAAWEFAVKVMTGALVGIVFGVSVHVFVKAMIWLFPSLDPEVIAKKQQLAQAYRMRDEMKTVPDDLAVVIRLLEKDLGITPTRDDRGETEALLKQMDHQRQSELESMQMKTIGVKKTNVESHQDATLGRGRGKVESGYAEAVSDQNAKEIEAKVKRNIYGVEVEENGQWRFVGSLLFLSGKVALTNRHILEMIKGRKTRVFGCGSLRRGVLYTQEQMSELNYSVIDEGIHAKKDVALIEMPRHTLMHGDLRKYFMTKADFGLHKQLERVAVVGFGRDLAMQQRYSEKCEAVDRVDFLLTGTSAGEAVEVREWYRYGVQSQPGDCGSAVIAFDPAFERKLIGLHMAGYNSKGYLGVGVAVHRELLDALLEKLKLRNAESLHDGVFVGGGSEGDEIEGDFVNHGQAAAKTPSGTTVIRPSPVHGVLQKPVTKPAHLRPFYGKDGGVVDPLEMARAKADTPNVPVCEKTLRECSAHLSTLLLDLKKDDRDDKVLTWEEAITGTEDPCYGPIKRNTSPGYGWESRGAGKEPWLGSGETYVVDHPDVIRKRDEMMARLLEGKRASTVFIDTLKDERRPIEKVDAGKTRLFSAGEMVYCILFRKYFLGFMAHVMRNCVDAESCVGINPFGQAWSTLADRMREVGPHVVAGDFSNYDGTLNSSVLWACLDVVEAFYENSTEEERLIRRGLWVDLVNSVHFTVPFNGTQFGEKGYLYQWSHSQPSGNPMTVILNSVYHSIVARMVYKMCARKYCPEMVSLKDWNRYVRHNNYGDDDLYNIHPKIAEWFNQITMTEQFATIGMTYTDEAKTGQLVKYRRLEDVSFLKRKFEWDPIQVRWRCPHSLEVILEMAMWVKRGRSVHELTAEVLEEAVHELAQHREDVFDLHMPKFEEARRIVREKYPCNFATYSEYQEVELARLGQILKPCDRDEVEIAEIDYVTAAVRPARHSGAAQRTKWESYSALEDDVCAHSKIIGYHPGTSGAGLSGPAHSTLTHPLADSEQQSEMSTLQTTTEEVVERHEIMTFHEEGQVNETPEVQETAGRVFRRLNDLDDTINNDVVGFLERPIHLRDFKWQATQTDAVQLWKVQAPRDWINQSMVREKLAGFRYVRCDLHFRVQINAQPFSAGLLMLVFVPMEEQQQTTVSSLAGFAGLTGYRHVLLDLSSDTACEMVVPYSGLVSHFDILKGYGTMGALKLMVYSPLTGTADVDGTVWCWASNVEVALPTGLPQIVATGPAHAGTKMKGQAAQPTEKDAAVKTKKPKGTVESIAGTVSTVAKALSGVPVIGAVAETVSWVSDAVGGIASWFGFSKPADTQVPDKMVPVVGNNFANFDGDAKVKSLALSWSNETEIPHQVFGCEEDEMAFSHILRRPNYLDRFKFTNANPQGAVIWKWPVDPMSCKKLRRTDPNVTPYYPGKYYCENNYISYLASFFKFARGSFIYDFKLVKTVYHSGRLRVIVVPGANMDTDVTTIDLNKVHSAIYDIRDTNEFRVEVPYKWNVPWKALDGDFGEDIPGKEITPNEPMAMVYVVVVNALRNPTTTADNIEIIVEQSAGEDFQFAFPFARRELELVSSEEQLRADYPAQPARKKFAMLEGGEDEVDHSGPAHAGVQPMLDTATSDQLTANAITMGEVVTGWRALLKRYSRWLTSSQVGTQWYTLPYDTATNYSMKSGFDLYSAAELMYRFVSGGLRIGSIARLDSVDGSLGLVVEHSLQAHDIHDARVTTAPHVLQSVLLEPLVELGIPFYQETPGMLTHVGRPKISDVTKQGTNYSELPHNEGTQLSTRSTTAPELWRSTGEDFSFGYLLGAPATLINHAVTPRVPCVKDWANQLSVWRSQMFGEVTRGAFDNPPRTTSINRLMQFTDMMLQAVFGPTKPTPVIALRTALESALTSNYGPAPGTSATTIGRGIATDFYQRFYNEFDSVCIPTP